MTPEELAAIEQRANAATEGPWVVEHWDDQGRIHRPGSADTVASNGGTGDWDDVAGPNSAFIAAARTDVPVLLAEVRRQAEVIELLQRRMSEQCMYSAGLKECAAGLLAKLARVEALVVDWRERDQGDWFPRESAAELESALRGAE